MLPVVDQRRVGHGEVLLPLRTKQNVGTSIPFA